MKRIINLTDDKADSLYLKDIKNLYDVNEEERDLIESLLNFKSLPTKKEMKSRAVTLTNLVKEHNATAALIDGPPFFMSTLEKELKEANIVPVYNFTELYSIYPNQWKHSGLIKP